MTCSDGATTSAGPTTVYGAHYEAFPLREGIRDDISIFGLTIKANVGFADLTSATSYFGRTGVQVQDASTSIYYSNNGGTPYVPVGYAERDPSHQLSEELRLTSHDIGGFHWVAGGVLQQAGFGMERNRREPARGDAGRARRIVLHLVERVRSPADRSLRRRILQVHRAVETLGGASALLPVQEPSGRVLVGPRWPEPHTARRVDRHDRQEQRRESAGGSLVHA